MTLQGIGAALAIACALGSASAAMAVPVTVTLSGVVDSTNGNGIDRDPAKLFGGGNLQNDLVSATLVYDTLLGFGTPDNIAGYYPDAIPVTSESVTISKLNKKGKVKDTYTYSLTPDYAASLFTLAGVGVEYTTNSFSGDSSFIEVLTDAAPGNLNFSFSAATLSSGSEFDLTGLNGKTDSITFDVTNIDVSAAPEPAAWALMGLGVGLTGAATRRRKSGPLGLAPQV